MKKRFFAVFAAVLFVGSTAYATDSNKVFNYEDDSICAEIATGYLTYVNKEYPGLFNSLDQAEIWVDTFLACEDNWGLDEFEELD